MSSCGPGTTRPENRRRDVVIIGSGAGGSPLALTLSRAGLDVLVLEKGPRHQPESFVHDELDEALNPHRFLPSLEDDPHILVRLGKAPERSTLGWIGRCVGGGTVRMGGYFYRFVPDDFRMRTRFGDFEELADWPYGYDELEPYYCRAEWEIGVSGGHGPLDGPRSRPLPMPAVNSHPLADLLDRACERLGVTSYSTPRAVNSRPHNGRPACSYCHTCGGYGCPTGAKGSTLAALLPRAEATGCCEILAGVMVRELPLDRQGRVTGCVYLDDAGKEHKVAARVVCVCCSAVESARLLLLSRSSRFPDGLANSSGRVGRHLQLHSGSVGRASFRPGRLNHEQLFDSNPYTGRSVMDHYFLPKGISPLAKGGILRFGSSADGPVSKSQALAFGDDQREVLWGAALEHRIREHFFEQREMHFEVFHDYLPNAGSRVQLDPEVKDAWGLPVARVYLDPCEHHVLAGEYLVDRGLEIFEAMGASKLRRGNSIGHPTKVHAHGTCRAGLDPRDSVLDPFCRAHEVSNLYVVDGSFMPTSGGAAPTLTILANSFRTADHLVARFRDGDFG